MLLCICILTQLLCISVRKIFIVGELMGPKIYTFDCCWQLASLPKDFNSFHLSRILPIFIIILTFFFVKGTMSLSQFVFPQSLVRLGILWIVKSFSSGIYLVLSVQFPFRCIAFFIIIFAFNFMLSFSKWEFYEVKFVDLLAFEFHIMFWKNSYRRDYANIFLYFLLVFLFLM